ncbi:MAG: hypothetical protein ACRESR_00750 [Gammaproteobacteria bacterium]
MRIETDKIASVTRGFKLGRSLTLTPAIEAVSGAVVAARVLNDKPRYNRIEDVMGRMNAVVAGDIVVGALGWRNALRGYEGVVPESVVPGGTLNLLNLGGVMGACRSHSPEVGPPFELEILGQVLNYPVFGSRSARPARVAPAASPVPAKLPACPVVYVTGSCMNCGKTAAASALVRHFRRSGLRVAGAKLTGVSLMRDILSMRDQGAEWVMDFTDAGAVSTDADNAGSVAHRIFSTLAVHRPDVIVAETGDGIMGEYGVQAILGDPALRALAGAFLYCANDPVGVAGGIRVFRERYGISVDMVAGPVTDNRVGTRFVEESLGIAACNALRQTDEFAARVAACMQERCAA